MRRLALLAGVAAVAAGLGTIGSSGAHADAAVPTVGAETCASGSIRAIINGKQTCLRAGQRCVKRFERQYHRYGFHCHRGRLRADAWIALESRPLHLPRIEPGAACPRSTGKRVDPNFGIAYGDGPAYPVMSEVGTDGIVHYGNSRREGGWYYEKVLWVVDPSHRERTLVRGRQIDGPNQLRFELGSDPPKELRIRRWSTVESGWGHRPSETRIRAPGCYAYQADGKDFSTVIVFQVAPYDSEDRSPGRLSPTIPDWSFKQDQPVAVPKRGPSVPVGNPLLFAHFQGSEEGSEGASIG